MNRLYLSLFFSICLSSFVYGQSSLSLQVIRHNGKLISITNNFPKSGFSSVTEFDFNFHTLGNKYWHKSYFLPRIGISIDYQQFGNKQVLGSGISLQPNITLQKHFGTSWKIESRTGLGIAFFNRPFNAITNPENTVIGSTVTASFSEQIALSKTIKKLTTTAGFSVWHWSNGHTSVPNVGGNFMGYSLSVSYNIREIKSTENYTFNTDSLDKKIHLDVAFTTGFHEVEGTFEPFDGPKFPVYGITIGATKRVGIVEKLTFGADFNYFTAYHDQIINQEIFDDNFRKNASNIVVFAGNEFLFGRLAFYTQIGFNAYTPFRKKIAETTEFNSNTSKNIFIYSTNKLGFRYYFFSDGVSISKKLYSEITLKTIFGKADFIQFKIGVNL